MNLILTERLKENLRIAAAVTSGLLGYWLGYTWAGLILYRWFR